MTAADQMHQLCSDLSIYHMAYMTVVDVSARYLQAMEDSPRAAFGQWLAVLSSFDRLAGHYRDLVYTDAYYIGRDYPECSRPADRIRSTVMMLDSLLQCVQSMTDITALNAIRALEGRAEAFPTVPIYYPATQQKDYKVNEGGL